MKKVTRPLKIGFVGGGINSAIGRTHLAAIGLDKKYELIGGCFSRDPVVSTQTATMYGLEENKGFHSVDMMLEKGKPDVVAVLTPSPSHRVCLQDIASSGLPVICEKPLVTSTKELELLDRCFLKSHPLFVTYNYTGYPMVREARDMVRHGELGNITQVILEMPQDAFIRPPRINGQSKPPQAWRLKDGVIPNVCLDLASHLIQMMRFVTGEEVASASGVFSNHSRFANIYDTATFSGVLTNGASTSFWVTKSALGYRNGLSFRVFGDRGSLFWTQTNPEILTIGKQDGALTAIDRSSASHEAFEPRYDRMKAGHPAGYIEAFANHYSDIYNVICHDHRAEKFVFGREDAFEELHFLESLAEGGTYVRPNKNSHRDIPKYTIPIASQGDRLVRANFSERTYRLSGND